MKNGNPSTIFVALLLSSLTGCDLLRVADGSVASLSQISTGQRAALVLSVFLTLNSSLRQGPPMMLVDDPVAHVDDMNSLALLDYLAEVAEAGQRQIFFATADDMDRIFHAKLLLVSKKPDDEKRQDRRFSPFELNQTTGTILAAIRWGCLSATAEISAALIQVLAACGNFDKPVINCSAML